MHKPEMPQTIVEDAQKTVLLYLAYSHSPISLDEIAGLTGLPVVSILNIMESLIAGGIVFEKGKIGKGIYFIEEENTARALDAATTAKERSGIINRLVAYYEETVADEDEAALMLARLYSKMNDGSKGAHYIKRAADYLKRIGQAKKAAAYYDYLLKLGSTKHIPAEDADFFIDIALERISAEKHMMPLLEQISILSTADELATRFKKWEPLSKIKLLLGQKLQAMGRHKEAYRCTRDFWTLAEESQDPVMLKTATLLMSEYLHWKGKFAEVVRQYEHVIGSLEEFGSNEIMLKAGARVGLCFVRCGQVARGMGMIGAVMSKARMLDLQHVIIFSHLMSMLSFFEIRQFVEAQKHVEKILSYPKDSVGHYILSPVYICQAYLLWMKDEQKQAMDYFKRCVASVKAIGWPHWNGAWNFDFLDEAESEGFVLPEFNYDDEAERIIGWDDIYMKGVAYRYRAQRLIKHQKAYEKALSDLNSSEKYLKESGAQLELARTRIALGTLLMQRGETQKARVYLEKAWSLFSRVDAGLFPKDLLSTMPQEQKVENMVERMITINESLGAVRDMQGFLKRVITMAMDFTMAMRGAFIIQDDNGQQTILASRNLDPLILKTDQLEFIKFVTQKAARLDREIIVPPAGSDHELAERFQDVPGIDSLICMPVKLKGTTYGFLYLDNRFGQKGFLGEHLPYIRLVCSQSAVGIANIKKYDEMKQRKIRFEEETHFYKREMGLSSPMKTIIGASDGIKRVLKGIEQVAPTDSAVLIMGETGVGKELAAKAIHNMSSRSDGPFIPVNLAALPQDLVASELFGYEKGAFTGASKKNKGRFELADGGTIFLDEIGDLKPDIQVKLLRVLQESSFERLGSARSISSDFRVIAATNKDLYAEVEKGSFRHDLFYRLNVFPLHIPPLRARKGDVNLLVNFFIKKYCKRFGKYIQHIPGDELEKLLAYQWPGNVRELKHLVERAVILYDGGQFRFSRVSGQHPAGEENGSKKFVPLADFEKKYIKQVLEAVHWKLSGPDSASAILDMKPTTLLYRMKKLGIRKPEPVL